MNDLKHKFDARACTSLMRANKSKRNQQQGFSLVELMVAMTIGMFILAAVGLVYMTSKNSFTYANNTVRMGEDASLAIDLLTRDVRMGAFGGCAGTTLARSAGPDTILYTADDIIDSPILQTTKSTPNLFSVTGLTDTFSAPNPFSNRVLSADTTILGFNGTDTASSAARTLINAPISDLTISTTAPILFVSGGSDKALQVSAAPVAGTSTLNFSGDPLKWNNDPTLVFRLISDCKGSEIFRSTSTTTAGVMTLESPLLNSYSADAIVTPVTSSTYFLAKRKNGSVTAATSSLYRRHFNGVAATIEELVPNVDAIHFDYGVNTALQVAGPNAGQPTFQTDVYVEANAVADWSRVVSVRIGFILVSDETNITPDADSTIKWIKGDYTPANTTDHRLRRAYSTTVSIRNRMGV